MKKSGKNASKSASAKASSVRRATSKVGAKASINFSRSVRGK